MNGVALLLAAATFGVASNDPVTYCWQKTDDGQVEYLVQAEAEVLPALVRGEQICSPVPAEAGVMNRFRFRIIAQGDPPAKEVKPASRFGGAETNAIVVIKPGSEPVETADVSTGWEIDKEGVRQFYVQIDPFLMRQLRAGDELLVPIPPIAGPVDNFVVSSGTAQLPRSPAPADNATSPATQSETTPAAVPSSRFSDTAALPNTGAAGSTDASRTSRFGTADAPADNAAPNPRATSKPNAGTTTPITTGENPSRFSTGNSSRFNPQADSGGSPATESSAGTFRPDNGSTGISRPPAGSSLWPNNPPASSTPPQTKTPPLAESRSPTFGGGLDRGAGKFESPRPLPTNPPAGQAQRTGYDAPADNQVAMNTPASSPRTTTRKPSKSPSNEEADDAAPAEKPWGWFVFVFCVMCLSLGANLYLGWTAAEFYSRYRTAVERLRTSGART